ncbi:MAG TPA: ankyrin repeat domain-containing protein [Bdellovibrionota bacterium]
MVQALFFILCLFPSAAFAFTYSVVEVKGKEAFVLGQGSSHRNAAKEGMSVQEGETIQTGPRSLVLLESSNGHKVHIGPNTSVLLREPGTDKGESYNIIELIHGGVRSMIRKGEGEQKKFELRRGNLNIGVRGTDFLTVTEGEGLEVFLNEGKVFLQNKMALTEGHQASISASGEIVRTASMNRFEFARAIERAGFGAESDDGRSGGGGSGRKKSDSTEEMIRKGDTAGLRAAHLSLDEINDLGNGEGVLHVAAKSGRFEVIQLALDLKADVNAQDSKGKTPLMNAIESRHRPSIELLLTNGANKKIMDNSGQNAHDYARKTENREIQNLLAK